MRILSVLRLILAGVCLCSFAIAQSNIVQNPGFESGTFAPWVARGWGVGGAGGAHTGTHYADTGCVGGPCIVPAPGTGAWLYQDLATTPGATYQLTFYYFPGPGTVAGQAELQVLWGASATQLTTGGPGACSGNCVFDNTSIGPSAYTQYTVANLVATSATTRVEFLGRQDPSYDGLDDVAVQLTRLPATATGVPALSSWAICMVVFLLAGVGVWSLKTHTYQR